MKIDEPKTPYHYYDSSEEEENESKHSKNWQELEDAVQHMHPSDQQLDDDEQPEYEFSEVGFNRSSESEDSGVDDNSPEKVVQRKQFAEKRKQHYNEFEMVRKMKQANDEDEDEDYEDNQNSSSTSTTTTSLNNNSSDTSDVDMRSSQ
eukprot:TRINITY_DN3112_c0_g1_i2.p1 TRINITY_DN3112_c0_g1~~TRINITY_DN3112_c0_g1_i2.p1  ORF type:complete len:148 (-),score=40.36 TRINITY_DN3112_c0_g1_i2:100-543(-)